jgi:hypothetical protein
MGQAYMTKFHFMGLDAGEYANYPTANADGTHFQEEGAQENARMITQEIARQASDSILAPLALLLAKKFPSNVGTNLPSGGTITRSRVFPPGATATLKVKVAAGRTFRYWANAVGDSIGKATLFSYVQDTSAHGYTAVFAGATEILPMMHPVVVGPRIQGVSVRGGRWTVRWNHATEGVSLRVFDLRGRVEVSDRALSGGDGVTEFVLPAGGIRLLEMVRGGRVVDARKVVP